MGAQKLYGDSFIPSIALTALLYFKDLKPALNKKDQSTIIGAVRKLNEKNLTKDGWMPWKSHFLCDKSISNRLDEDKKASFLSGLLRQEYKTKAETILNGNNPFGSRNLGEAKVVLYEKLLDMQDKNILPKQVDKGIER